MYAGVVVNQPARAVDRIFDYSIPKELEDSVRPGSRVLVPFTNGNIEMEAFVLYVTETTDVKSGIKSIIRLSAEDAAFRESMVPLIEFMHERYLATYLEIIHTIIPSGTSVKSIEWIILRDKDKYKGKSETYKRIMELLEDNGGGMDIYSLSTYFERDIKAAVSKLREVGAVEHEYRQTRDINKKKLRGVRLAAEPDAVQTFYDNSKSKIQKRMLSILMNNEFLTAADLVRFSMGSYGALAVLVKKGLAEFFDLYIDRPVYDTEGNLSIPPEPTPEQAEAISVINAAIDNADGETILLHGVTGSGKTEVFMRSIAHAAERGKTALLLVPEISLTPQMLSRFVARFGKRIAILHSGLSLGERYDQWSRIMDGDADIVIGARSAVFAPLDNLGIIIIDEEHSDTYKSEMSPRYHAREAAIYRAQMNGAVTLLASATPSMESYNKARNKEYRLLEMKRRYNENRMPDIEIVDMRAELERGNKTMFSKRLYEAVRRNIDRKEQTILFMNRRGYSTFVSCRKCGFVPQCPNCNISLTYHSYDNTLKCHYCGHRQPNYIKCPACSSKYIRYFGGGTQRVEEEVRRLFPDARTIRLDADVTGRKNAHKEILDRFDREKIDILIGTQMVAKGLDFANVTLVGVISADTMLHINDFRSGERTFDTLEQVSGRAGRGQKGGRAIIQTYDPDNFAIRLVKEHDYLTFYNKTCAERRAMWYPPFSEMICIRFTDTDNERTRRAAFRFRELFGDITKIEQRVAILGPIPSQIAKIKNQYRWQIIIKCDSMDALNDRLCAAQRSLKQDRRYESTAVSIDKNPITIY
ncbi:MAG: primosomal protein N' [Clostridiales bacterium]|nr:primosomal protein N' [Clostridiales bacterium]